MSTPEAKKESNSTIGDDKVSGERRALDGDDKVSREGVNHGESIVPPMAMEQILTAMAASVLHSASGMSSWGMADLTLGLYKVWNRHTLEKAIDSIKGVPVDNVKDLDNMLEWLSWAQAAYLADKPSLASTMKIQEEDVVKLVNKSAVMKPAFFIAVHRQRRCVVMGVRGTNTAHDVLTDLTPHSEPFEGGYAHSGMLAAAKWLLETEAQTLNDVLHANPDFGLVLAGHSLGAGTIALLGLLLRETFSTPSGSLSNTLKIPAAMVTCWGFGCPPCVDLNLALTSSSFINNIVLQDDVVARASAAALEDLRSEIAETAWSQAFKDGSRQKRVVDLLNETAERLSKGITPETITKAKESGYSALLEAGGAMISKLTTVNTTNTTDTAEAKNSWRSFGAAVAGGLFIAASKRVKEGVHESLSEIEKNTQMSDEGVAATAVAVNAAQSTSNQDGLVNCRLYVPGSLYHIVREPLQQNPSNQGGTVAQQNSKQDDSHSQKQTKQGGDDSSKQSKSKDGKGSKKHEEIDSQEQSKPEGSDSQDQSKEEGSVSTTPKFRYTVVKGTDPKSRFNRIVLSNSLISDHTTPSYVEALVGALQHASIGATPKQ